MCEPNILVVCSTLCYSWWFNTQEILDSSLKTNNIYYIVVKERAGAMMIPCVSLLEFSSNISPAKFSSSYQVVLEPTEANCWKSATWLTELCSEHQAKLEEHMCNLFNCQMSDSFMSGRIWPERCILVGCITTWLTWHTGLNLVQKCTISIWRSQNVNVLKTDCDEDPDPGPEYNYNIAMCGLLGTN